MRARALTVIVWTVTAFMIAIGVSRARSALGTAAPASLPVWPPPTIVAVMDSDSLAALADRITQSDPFRMARKPADVTYDPTRASDPPPAAPAARSLPPLVVAGIVGGPPWTALVNGAPGRDGSASVRAGDTIAGTKVIAVARTSVTLSMADTTWRLTLHVPWP